MAVVQIVMKDLASFTEETVLNGVEYSLRFDWNVRGEFWSMTIADRNGNVILSNKRLVIGYPILENHHALEGLPDGEFVVDDSNETTKTQEPGRHDFVSGRKLKLLFFEGGV